MLPYYRSDREYEGEAIQKARIERGLTIAELCNEVGIGQGDYSSLVNGTKSPLYLVTDNAGYPKPQVVKLLKYLELDFEDAFPRYFCKFESNKLVDEQISELWRRYEAIDPEIIYENREYAEQVLNILNKLRQHEKEIILYRYIDEMTYAEIGEEYGVSVARVMQVHNKALAKLKRNLNQQQETDKNNKKQKICPKYKRYLREEKEEKENALRYLREAEEKKKKPSVILKHFENYYTKVLKLIEKNDLTEQEISFIKESINRKHASVYVRGVLILLTEEPKILHKLR